METLFRRHFWIINVLGLALVAYLATRIVQVWVGHKLQSLAQVADTGSQGRPVAETRARNRDFAAASEANIFGAKRESLSDAVVAENRCASDADCEGGTCTDGSCTEAEGPVGEKENAVRSELRARLVGTAVFSEPEFSLASIVDMSGGKGSVAELYSIQDCQPIVAQQPLVEGEEPPPPPPIPPCNRLLEVAIVKEIEADRVYLFNETERRWEYLLLGDEPEKGAGPVSRAPRKPKTAKKDDDLGKGITKVSDTNYQVTQDEVDKALGNLSSLATQARIVPAFEGGEAVGFKLFSIRPNSLYSKIGIQNGDVITRINGYEINSPDKALEVYQKLKDSKSINVDLKRRGKPMTLEYGITP